MNKTSTITNRIQAVDNFLNLAYFCESWQDFIEEIAEWGVYSIAKIDFDDKELNIDLLDNFILIILKIFLYLIIKLLTSY